MKKFALIGAAGYIAPRHFKAINDTNNFLSLAYDKSDSVGRLDEFSHEIKFATSFEEFMEIAWKMNSSPKTKLDYVVVCSPNHFHFSHIYSGLKLGCDVICEKPLVSSTRELDELAILQNKTGKKVFTILQLRLHQEILKIKKQISLRKSIKKYQVNLTYITSRGKWYMESWKGDYKKSFGVCANIGIHFFDMLSFIFGKCLKIKTHYLDKFRGSGFLEFEKAQVSWFLSIDKSDLPSNFNSKLKTFRAIKYDDNEIEFSGGFTDLHTLSYENILNGHGFGIDDSRESISIVEKIMNNKIEEINLKNLHPSVIKYI